MSIIRLILMMCLLFGAIGCNKKPIVNASASPIPNQFPSLHFPYKTISDVPNYTWWKKFHDPILNSLIQTGLQNNMDVHIALARLQQSQGELKQIKLSWIPNLQILAGYSTNPALGVPGGFYGAWPTYFLNIMQLATQEKIAKYRVDYQKAVIEGVRLTLIGNLASAYLTLSAELEQVRLIRVLLSDIQALISLTEKEIRIGLSNDIDLAQLRSDAGLVNANLKPVLHNIVLSQNALRYLINQNPGIVENKLSFARVDLLRFKPGSLPASVLNNRPDMKMAKYSLNIARLGTRLTYSDLFPAVQLDDFLGEAKLPSSSFEQATDAYLTWTFKPSVFGKMKSSKGNSNAVEGEFRKTIIGILQNVDNAFSANQRMSERYLSFKQAERIYRHKYNLQNGLLNSGLISYKDLLLSKINLDRLALSTNEAKLELAMSMVHLYQELAIGYGNTKTIE